MGERIKKIRESFLTGFFNGGTPFSAKNKIRKLKCTIQNPLRERADQLLEEKSFEDDDLIDSVCYFSGGIIGLTIAPIDAVITFCGDVKRTFKIE